MRTVADMVDVAAAYRVKAAFMAVRPDDKGPRFITIPAGTLITLVGEPQRSGFVDILYGEEIAAAFVQDIEDRCELVQAQTEP